MKKMPDQRQDFNNPPRTKSSWLFSFKPKEAIPLFIQFPGRKGRRPKMNYLNLILSLVPCWQDWLHWQEETTGKLSKNNKPALKCIYLYCTLKSLKDLACTVKIPTAIPRVEYVIMQNRVNCLRSAQKKNGCSECAALSSSCISL